MSRIFKTLYLVRDRITFWAIKTTKESYDDDEDADQDEPGATPGAKEDFEPEELDFSEEGRGMRTERILRALIHVPVRWFQLNYHARSLERSLNKEHPECKVRVKVVDRLVGDPFIEHIFDVGLILIPTLFLLSFALWAASRFVASSVLAPAALVVVCIAAFAFIIFGLMFMFVAFFGYEFDYVDGRRNPRRRRNPPESYQKLA